MTREVLLSQATGIHRAIIAYTEDSPFGQFAIQQLYSDDFSTLNDGMKHETSGGLTILLSFDELLLLSDTIDKYLGKKT